LKVDVNKSIDPVIRFERIPQLPNVSWRDGGEASIFQHPQERDILVKVFRGNQKNLPRVGAAAERLRDLWSLSEGLSPSQSRRLSDSFSWPTVLYGQSLDRIDGVGIRRAADEFWLTYTTVHETINTVQNIAFLGPALSKPAIVKAPYTSTSLEIRIEIVLELLWSMKVLWELGFRYCDYSENNILWAFHPRPKIFIIDVEGCARPGTSENFSPGWEPLTSQLGYTLETDRSQCALVVWRILAGNMQKAPPVSDADSPASSLRKNTVQLITELRQTGAADLIDLLIIELKQYRAKVLEDIAFEWAITTKYAKTVLDYSPRNPDTRQAQIIQDAIEQKRLEEEILQSDVRFRRAKLNRAIPVSGFEFDISEQTSNLQLQQDSELLREMALVGNFEDIAEVFVNEADCMELNQVVRRSIQVALSHAGGVTMQYIGPTNSNDQRFEWDWPGADYANCARIEVVGPDEVVLDESVAFRSKNRAAVMLPIDNDFPHNSELRLTVGLVTQNRQFVYSPFSTKVPIPSSSGRQKKLNASTVVSSVRMIDREWTPIPPRPSVSVPASSPSNWRQPSSVQAPRAGSSIPSNNKFPPSGSRTGYAAQIKNRLFKIFRE